MGEKTVAEILESIQEQQANHEEFVAVLVATLMIVAGSLTLLLGLAWWIL